MTVDSFSKQPGEMIPPEDTEADTDNRPAHEPESGRLSVSVEFASSQGVTVPPGLRPYVPFPVSALPQPLRPFVAEQSRALEVDAAMVALPALAACAAAIGNSRVVQPKPGWTEPCVLWAAIVAASGHRKSPAFRAVVEPLHKRESDNLKAQDDDLIEHEIDLARWDVDLQKWKKGPQADDPPLRPLPPMCERLLLSETTIEAAVDRLTTSPRGLFLVRDELSGFIGGFDRYNGAKSGSADQAQWLECYNAGSIIVDRKTGPKRTLHVDRAAVSMTGTIQPGIFARVFSRDRFDSGFVSRWLLAMPPKRQRRWKTLPAPQSVSIRYSQLFQRLLSLQLTEIDGEPVVVPLSRSGAQVFGEFYDWLNGDASITFASDDMDAARSKFEGTAARLGLVFHEIRVVWGDDSLESHHEIDGASVGAAVAIIKWCLNETERIYAILHQDEADSERRKLIDWVQSRGGRVSIRESQRSGPCFATKGEAAEAFYLLEELGLGRMYYLDPPSGGGRQIEMFELASLMETSCEGGPGGCML